MVRKLKVRGVDSISDFSQAIYDATGVGVRQALDSKQTILIPGTTIKTINGQNILGSGDISIVAGGTPGGATNQIQYNSAGALAGDAGFEYDSTTKTLKLNTLLIHSDGTEFGTWFYTADAVNAAANAGALQIYAGTAVNGAGGEVDIFGGNTTGSGQGGNLSMNAGTSETGTGGAVYLGGGTSSNGPIGGSVSIFGGTANAHATGLGGTVSLKSGSGKQSGDVAIIASNGFSTVSPDANGGTLYLSIGAKTGSGAAGALVLKQGVNSPEDFANPAIGVELLRINANGAWSPGFTGVNFGTAGQLLASAGAGAPPDWLSAAAARDALNTGDFTPLTNGMQLAVGGVYSGDTTAAALSVTMPTYANSKLGSRIVIFNTRYNWATNVLTVQVGSEHIIRNAATNLVCDTTFDAVTLVCVYKDGTKAHWNII